MAKKDGKGTTHSKKVLNLYVFALLANLILLVVFTELFLGNSILAVLFAAYITIILSYLIARRAGFGGKRFWDGTQPLFKRFVLLLFVGLVNILVYILITILFALPYLLSGAISVTVAFLFLYWELSYRSKENRRWNIIKKVLKENR